MLSFLFSFNMILLGYCTLVHVAESCMKWLRNMSVWAAFYSVVMLVWTSSMSWNDLLLRVVFVVENRKKSAGVKSGEQDGWLMSTMFEITEKCIAVTAELSHLWETVWNRLSTDIFFPRSSWICFLFFCLMCSWCSVSFEVMLWSEASISQTFVTVSRFQAFGGCPLLGSLSGSLPPSLNLLNDSKTGIQHRTSFP